MLDENRDETTNLVRLAGGPKPRQLIDALDLTLRRAPESPTEALDLLDELAESLARWYADRASNDTRENAMLRAPWLTADAARLTKQQADVLCSVQGLRSQASHPRVSFKSLLARFEEFVDLYNDHEKAEGQFLEAAFPGPKWTEQW